MKLTLLFCSTFPFYYLYSALLVVALLQLPLVVPCRPHDQLHQDQQLPLHQHRHLIILRHQCNSNRVAAAVCYRELVAPSFKVWRLVLVRRLLTVPLVPWPIRSVAAAAKKVPQHQNMRNQRRRQRIIPAIVPKTTLAPWTRRCSMTACNETKVIKWNATFCTNN